MEQRPPSVTVLHQESLDKRIQVAIEHILHIAGFDIGAQVLHQFIGMEDIIPDL